MKTIIECDYRPGLRCFDITIDVPECMHCEINIEEDRFTDFIHTIKEGAFSLELSDDLKEKIIECFERELNLKNELDKDSI